MYPKNKKKKSLGQNFLIDNNIISKIIKIGNITKNQKILEIGPGLGSLTNKINEMKPKSIFAVEKDTKVWFFELVGVRGIGSPIELVRPLLNLFNPNLFVVIAESWMK